MGTRQDNYVADMVRFADYSAAEAISEYLEDYGPDYEVIDEEPWTDEDEAGLEQYEIDRRERLAEQNEY